MSIYRQGWESQNLPSLFCSWSCASRIKSDFFDENEAILGHKRGKKRGLQLLIRQQ
jgi:hypothetical protein